MRFFRLLAFLLLILIVLVILAVNLGIGSDLYGPIYELPYGDKVAHFLLYGVVAFLMSLGFPPARMRVFGISLLKTSILLALFVTLEEVSQVFFINRTPSPFDLAAGYAGIFFFSALSDRLRGGPEHIPGKFE